MHRQKSGEGSLFIIQRNNKAEAVVSKNNKLRRRELNLYLLTEVDCIIHTAGVEIGYMMDGQAGWAPIPLGNLSIYLLIYLFTTQKDTKLYLPNMQ